MQPFLSSKAEGGIEQALYIEEDQRSDKIELLEGYIEEDIPIRLVIIPAAEAQHPGTDIEYTEKEEKTEPLVGTGFVYPCFAEEQERVDESVNEKYQEQGTL